MVMQRIDSNRLSGDMLVLINSGQIDVFHELGKLLDQLQLSEQDYASRLKVLEEFLERKSPQSLLASTVKAWNSSADDEKLPLANSSNSSHNHVRRAPQGFFTKSMYAFLTMLTINGALALERLHQSEDEKLSEQSANARVTAIRSDLEAANNFVNRLSKGKNSSSESIRILREIRDMEIDNKNVLDDQARAHLDRFIGAVEEYEEVKHKTTESVFQWARIYLSACGACALMALASSSLARRAKLDNVTIDKHNAEVDEKLGTALDRANNAVLDILVSCHRSENAKGSKQL